MAVNEKTGFRKRTNPAARILFLILLICLMAGGAFQFQRTTPKGVGLVSDSVNYINGARSIAAGDGYFRESGGGTLKPITNFPPFYSILLSIPLYFGLDWTSAAWGFSFVFYILNIGLIGLLVCVTLSSEVLGLAAAALFVLSKPFLYFQVFAMSEPLFFFCTLMAFLLFDLARKRENSNGLIWLLCGLFCGFAFLTRYVGIVSLCAVLVALLSDFRLPRKRSGKAILFTLIGALPVILAWLVRNVLVSGNAANRAALFHPLSAADFKTGVLIFWQWLFPLRYENLTAPVGWMRFSVLFLLAGGAVFLLVCLIRIWRTKRSLPDWIMQAAVYVLYILGYLAFVVLTISLFDASVNIEERILYPAFLVLILLAFTLARMVLSQKRWVLGLAAAAVYVLAAANFSQDLVRFIPRFSSEGYGWAWEGWRTSPAMEILRELPEETVIYSNQLEAVSLWAERGAYALLDPIDPSSNLPREGYAETMAVIRQQVLSGESVLVFFGVQAWIEPGTPNWVTELCEGLPVIYQDTSEWVIGQKADAAEIWSK